MVFFDLLVAVILVSIVAPLGGFYLVMQGKSMTTLAFSHSVIFGIMVMYLLVRDIESPFLLIGAALTTFLIVSGFEFLERHEAVNTDAALGFVYLTIFAAGVILVSLYASEVNISPSSVVTGNFAYVPFKRLVLVGQDLGPLLVWQILAVFFVLVIFQAAFSKELNSITFDPDFAAMQGIPTRGIQSAYMFLVSVVVVSLIRVAGVIVILALMVVPVATARTVQSTVNKLLVLSVLLSILASVSGFLIAWKIGAAEISSVVGLMNTLIFFFALSLNHLHKMIGKGSSEDDL